MSSTVGCDDVCMDGIHGMGEISKPTIAKAVDNLFDDQFRSCSLLANFLETKKQFGLIQLQKTLLSETLENTNLKVGIRN